MHVHQIPPERINLNTITRYTPASVRVLLKQIPKLRTSPVNSDYFTMFLDLDSAINKLSMDQQRVLEYYIRGYTLKEGLLLFGLNYGVLLRRAITNVYQILEGRPTSRKFNKGKKYPKVVN